MVCSCMMVSCIRPYYLCVITKLSQFWKIITQMQEIKCPSCSKDYSDNNPPRILTMCGHTFCHQCLKTMIKRKEYKCQIRCPVDKQKLTLDSSSPLQFPRNMLLIEAINKNKPKVEVLDEKNQFLPKNGQTTLQNILLRSSETSSGMSSRRNSIEEGLCLLHQKPFDIICLEEKMSICAECALFGLHRGHSFSTVRDLELKRNEWVSEISEIMEKKRQIDQRTSQTHIEGELTQLITKKKEESMDEISVFFAKARVCLDEQEVKLKADLGDRFETITSEATSKGKIRVKNDRRQEFSQWQSHILDAIGHLESMDIIKSIDIFAELLLNKEDNIINKGHKLVEKMEGEHSKSQKQVEDNLRLPKITFNQNLQSLIESLAMIEGKSDQEESDKACLELNQSTILPLTCDVSLTTNYDRYYTEPDDVSLLDLREDDQREELNFSRISILKEETILPQQQKMKMKRTDQVLPPQPSEIMPRSFKKAKTTNVMANKSLINLQEGRNLYQSPKFKRNDYTAATRCTLYVPTVTSPKDKLRRSIFKVKDPERFEKLLKALEVDLVETLDFTGLSLGNEIVKELTVRLKQSKKVRNIRLMKNQLSDDCIPALLDCLPNLEVLNLAQNSFSLRIVDLLLDFAKSSPIQKQKNIQLGQNSINPRRCKQKIEELKQLGISISL